MNRSMLEGSELLQFSLPDQGGLGEVRSVHITSTGRRGKLCSLAMFKQAKQVQSPSEFDCKEVGTEGALSTFEIILILFSFFFGQDSCLPPVWKPKGCRSMCVLVMQCHP